MRTLLILCLAYVLFIHGLGSTSLWDPDEPRQAIMAREMMARGDYIHPYLNGLPYLEKPPLHPWLIVAAAKLTGKINEFSARIPSAVAAAPSAPARLPFRQEARPRGIGLSVGPDPGDELPVPRQRQGIGHGHDLCPFHRRRRSSSATSASRRTEVAPAARPPALRRRSPDARGRRASSCPWPSSSFTA